MQLFWLFAMSNAGYASKNCLSWYWHTSILYNYKLSVMFVSWYKRLSWSCINYFCCILVYKYVYFYKNILLYFKSFKLLKTFFLCNREMFYITMLYSIMLLILICTFDSCPLTHNFVFYTKWRKKNVFMPIKLLTILIHILIMKVLSKNAGKNVLQN